MDHQQFMQTLRRAPNAPSYEIVSRIYKNASGVDEIIWLNRGYWEQVDWLESRGDIDFSEWVVHCDNNPFEDWALSSLLMYWLWLDECNRFRENLPTFKPYPPMGYEGWADEYHARSGS